MLAASCVAKYSVEVKPSARKELEKLSGKLIERMFPKLEALGDEPRPAGCKKLRWSAGVADTHWDYRVVYTIDYARLRVSVTRIRHRSEVYEG